MYLLVRLLSGIDQGEAAIDDADRVRLERFLDVETETGRSLLERFRRPPRAPTIDGMVGAFNRLGEVQRVAGSRCVRPDGVATGRVRALAADAVKATAQRQRAPT